MKHIFSVAVLAVIFAFAAAAQTSSPQAVAWVCSPLQIEFAGMTPPVDFPADVILKVKTTAANQTFRITIVHEPVTNGTTPTSIVVVMPFGPTIGWVNTAVGLPSDFRVKTVGGVIVEQLVVSGTPLPVLTVQ